MDLSSYERLPAEILEKIFQDVPAKDIPFQKPWVCRRWSEIVHKPSYWRKRAETLNIKMSSDEWSVLKNHDDKMASAKCLRQICVLFLDSNPYKIESNQLNILTITDKSLSRQKESEEIINARMEHDINTACASILLGYAKNISIYSSRSLNSAQSYPLLIEILGIRNSASNNMLEVLEDEFSWWNFTPTFPPQPGFSNKVLLRSLNIERFKGCLHNIHDMSKEISHLSLAIAIDERNATIDPGLNNIKRISSLRALHIHIKAGTEITLGNLPYSKHVTTTINFSLVGPSHINWVVIAAKRLQLKTNSHRYRMYGCLVFIDCLLSNQQMKEMLRGIHDTGVGIKWQVLATGPILEEAEDDELSNLVYELWPKIMGGYLRLDSKYDLVNHLEGQYEW